MPSALPTTNTKTSARRAATHQLDEVVALGVREEAAVQERPARTNKQTSLALSQTQIGKQVTRARTARPASGAGRMEGTERMC
jgi:hypothetical protein